MARPVAHRSVLALAALAVVAGCDRPPPAAPAAPTAGVALDLPPDTVDVRGVARAEARVEPAGGGRAEGTVTFGRVDGGVRVRAVLSGLSESDFHALQVLRGRDCAADPDVHLGADVGTPHGGPYAPPGLRHAGDLGNVRGDGGRGRYDRVDPVLTFDGTASLVGRAVVVRAGRDDAASVGGAAGAVVGCGVIEAG